MAARYRRTWRLDLGKLKQAGHLLEKERTGGDLCTRTEGEQLILRRVTDGIGHNKPLNPIRELLAFLHVFANPPMSTAV